MHSFQTEFLLALLFSELLSASSEVRRGFHKRCNEYNPCPAGHECVLNRCAEKAAAEEVCDPAVSVPIGTIEKKEIGTCGGILGEACIGIGGFCGNGLDCKKNRCSCAVGLEEYNGTCKVAHNFKCSDVGIDECSPEFHCVDRICKCKQPQVQIVITEKSGLTKCVSKILGPCDDDTSCVNNAECVTLDTVEQCRCKAGYIHADGFCDLAYKSECPNDALDVPEQVIYTNSDGSEATFETSCDRVGGLKCVKGICLCEDEGSVFDAEVRRCRRLAGATCTEDNNCIKHATCFKSPSLPPICRCDQMFGIDKDRTCRRNSRPQIELWGKEMETCKWLCKHDIKDW